MTGFGSRAASDLVFAGSRLSGPILPLGLKLKNGLARSYRPLLARTCFIGVTGSCGKTTAKRLIGAVVSLRGRTRVSWTLTNGPDRIPDTMLTVTPWHKYCVQEMGGFAPGILSRSASLVRPRIGVVMHVGFDHYSAFRGLRNTAREKATLVARLPADGTAILNADDPWVLAMRGLTRAKVITFGLSSEAAVRGSRVSSVWPEPLSLTAGDGSEEVRVRTRLYGEHWASAVLAALAVGRAVGIPLSAAARAIEGVEPSEGRMSVVRPEGGPVFLLDTWKSPSWTIPAVNRFLSVIRGVPRTLVVGTISDFPGDQRRVYRRLARESLCAADSVIFVGPNAHSASKAGQGVSGGRLRTFETIRELAAVFRASLAPGDLVVLKGSGRDHLERLALDRVDTIRCWRSDCRLPLPCHRCRFRSKPSP